MELIGEPGGQAILEIKSKLNLIKVENKITNELHDYIYEIKVNINNCVVGEYPKTYSTYTECVVC